MKRNFLNLIGVLLLAASGLPATAAGQTVSIDQPGRIAYQSQLSKASCSEPVACYFRFPDVPAGHRLVVQHLSGLISFSTAPNSIWVLLNNGSGRPVSMFFAPLVPSTYFTAFDQTVLAYFDPAEFGGIIEVQVNLSGGTPSSDGANMITLSGYLLDCNAAPCAPIAH